MDHPIHWLYQQFVGAVPETAWRCYLCGAWCGQEAFSVATGIADTFNSHYLARCPHSPWLCAACAWYFDSHADHPDFRKMSLIVARRNWHNWQRADMLPDIEQGLTFGFEGDRYLIVSLSKKKHIVLQTPMTASSSRHLAIQVEEQTAYPELWQWRMMRESFCRLLALGHNKGEILSGNLYGNTLRKHGRLDEALLLSDQIAPYRGAPLLDLLSYVTIVEKEESENTDANGNDRRPTPAAESGRRSLVGGLDGDRPGVQIEVPPKHLGASRNHHRGVRAHDHEPRQVPERGLWET